MSREEWIRLGIVLGVWAFFAFATAAVADRKGRDGNGWFLIGLLLGVFALIAVLLLPRQRSAEEEASGAEDGELRLTLVGIVGLVFALGGAAAMVLGVFLPRVDEGSTGFLRIAENTLIQSGDGIAFLVIAAVIVAASLLAVSRSAWGWLWAGLVASILGMAFALYLGTDTESLTIYPLNEAGQPNTSLPGQKARPGIGLWLAGIGATLSLLGTVLLQRGRDRAAPRAEAQAAADAAADDDLARLERLDRLRATGALSDEEFQREKTKLIGP